MRAGSLLGASQRLVYASSVTLPLASRRALSMTPRALGIVKVPTMAESLTEGTLKQWYKKVGDVVKEGDEVATIETDKVRFALCVGADGRSMLR